MSFLAALFAGSGTNSVLSMNCFAFAFEFRSSRCVVGSPGMSGSARMRMRSPLCSIDSGIMAKPSYTLLSLACRPAIWRAKIL
jgi:hypothetical protein